ncbi:MAG: sulfite exporter TauE/SafE family protein [Synergistaceae bacterium]|jgi:uncharacterized membrane protein YfcA|nr:sulfite exporter TauE/SafE family protein [Synergistaceae bacterium]
MEMNYFVCALTSMFTSIVGSICGIGGGILLKPVLDATRIFGVSEASYLSSCTVLAMACASVANGLKSKNIKLDGACSIPITLGSVLGGFTGRYFFDFLCANISEDIVGDTQAALLLLVTFITFIYTLNEKRVRKFHVNNKSFCLAIGLCLGVVASFLGIGGGPINLMVLSLLFGMDTKTAALNSLCIISFSLAVSVSSWIYIGNITNRNSSLLVLMAVCGIFGGLLGRRINDIISEHAVRNLFLSVMVSIMLICSYNLIK